MISLYLLTLGTLGFVAIGICAVPANQSLSSQRVHKILVETPVVDSHNDVPWNLRKSRHNVLDGFKFESDLSKDVEWMSVQPEQKHTSIPRLKVGGIGIQFWAAYVHCNSQYKDAVEMTLEQIDVIKRLTKKHSTKLYWSQSTSDIHDSLAQSKIASLIGVEGGHSIQSSFGILRMFYELGVRYLTLTHNCNTPWSDSCNHSSQGVVPMNEGISPFGMRIVHEMNRLGMMVDLSHTSHDLQMKVLKESKAPVIYSHSGVFAKCAKTRNVADDALKLVKINNGVVMISFYGAYARCDGKNSTIDDIVEHIEHVRKVAGVDHVGLGSDYDGVSILPEGLEDPSKIPDLFAKLIDRGNWNDEDIKKIASKNFLRVFADVEKVRDKLKHIEPAEGSLTRDEMTKKNADFSAITATFPGDPLSNLK